MNSGFGHVNLVTRMANLDVKSRQRKISMKQTYRQPKTLSTAFSRALPHIVATALEGLLCARIDREVAT